MTEPPGPPPRSHGRLQPVVSARPRPLMEERLRAGGFRVKVLTLFPDLFPGALGFGLTGKALEAGLWSLEALDIRRFARDKHRSVDDAPFGGGPGMVMKPDVVAAALDRAQAGAPRDRGLWPVIYLSPRGRPFDQARARALAAGEGLTLLCGRYEGLDQRVIEARGLEEVSVGDFVLTGGEIAALAVIDATLRLRPGVLGNAESPVEESFSQGLLEHPHYTRPPVWEGHGVPEVLLSGNHAAIARWRRAQAERVTTERRPDLRGPQAAPAEAEQSDAPTPAPAREPDGGRHED